MLVSIKRFLRRKEILYKARSKRAVLLFAGHSSKTFFRHGDPGAIANDTTEHKEVKRLVQKAAVALRESGYNVCYPPFHYTLREKINFANKYPADSALVSVHMNWASPASISGTEVWIRSGNKNMENPAFRIATILERTLSLRNRGVKGDLQSHRSRLGILHTRQMDEVLLELGFLTNKKDLEQVRKYGVQAIIDSVVQLFYKDVFQ